MPIHSSSHSSSYLSLRSLLLWTSLLLTAATISATASSESRSQPSLRGLVINGNDVDSPNRHPYFALMNEMGLCGAVLISNRFVLTAAHCVGADNDFEIGIVERGPSTNTSDSGGREYGIQQGFIHPDYDDTTVDSDIAIFELNTTVDLPYLRLERDPVDAPGTNMTVLGFGLTQNYDDYFGGFFSSEDYTSTDLLEATVDYVPTTECNEILQEHYGSDANPITPSMLCAFDEEFKGEDSCQGDSGGPLILKGNDPSEDSLVGLVSWGHECGGDTPGAYTRISHFYDWIVATMCSMNPEGVPDYVDCSTVDENQLVGGILATLPPAHDDDWWFDDDWLLWDDDDNGHHDDDWWSGDDWWHSDDDNAHGHHDDDWTDDIFTDQESLFAYILEVLNGWFSSLFGS